MLLISTKKNTLYAAEQLGKCYRFINDYKQTESWYAIAAGMPKTNADNFLQYAKALQQNMKYTEAKEQYQKYASTNKLVSDVQKELWELSCDSALIIDCGIDKNRIVAKGYGEVMLLNNCSNGVTCSEVDHQLNRRTEFKITKM